MTYTGSVGIGTSGWGPHAVFLRNGMTSRDTLGWGASGNVSSIVPSVTVNASIPDQYNIPLPWKAKVSSIEAGVGSPGASAAMTYTWTPQQVSDYLARSGLVASDLLRRAPSLNLVTPAMGPNDELSPFERDLRGGVGSAGAPSEAPLRYLSRSQQGALGDGMGDWRTSAAPVLPWSPTAPAASSPQPGGLYGLMLDYLRDNYPSDR
ncbi:hypothetical protein [Bradyrhizobium sp. Ce-3]|uniref:hypothetical protein n=1 Tax=Bradyrhizobium sp. Ce-3 TaxID=2913970 RepID=UPI001FC7FD31|nr:hypothetical protein [Bradyrhizobium sp. Ce-3]